MSFAVAASRLTNPFIGEVPKRVETRLNLPGLEVSCLAFNDRGSYLACGTQMGDLVIFDMCTQALALRVPALHSREITSVSWVKCGKGRLVCTVSGSGRTVKVFCLEQERIVSQLSFPRQDIFDAQVHPTNANLCLVSLEDSTSITWPALYRIGGREQEAVPITQYQPPGEHARTAKLAGICSIFTRHGHLVLVGGVGNSIHVFNTDSGEFLKSFHPDTTKGKTGWCVHMTLSRNGRTLGVVGHSKIISIYDVSSDRYAKELDCNRLPADASLEQIQDALRWRAGQILRFKRHVCDAVSNTKWNDICCSGNTGEFLLAVNAQKDLHELNVWDLTSGRLVEVLKDDIQPKVFGYCHTCVWHPFRALVATVDGNGQICLWGNQEQGSKTFTTTAASSTDDKNWLAFVPDFVEIEENEVYTGAATSSSRASQEENDEEQRRRTEGSNRKIVEDEECEVDVLDMTFLPPNGDKEENEDSDEEVESVRVAPRRVTRGIGYFIPVKPPTAVVARNKD